MRPPLRRLRHILFLLIMAKLSFDFGCKEPTFSEMKLRKAQTLAETIAGEEIRELSKLNSDDLVAILNRPLAAPVLKKRYPIRLDKRESKVEMTDSAYSHGDMIVLFECVLASRGGVGLFASLSDLEWVGLMTKCEALSTLIEKDNARAISWLRASAGKTPTVSDAIFAMDVRKPDDVNSRATKENFRESWLPLLCEENMILFSVGLRWADDFATNDELLEAFERATATEWPALHSTAIENLRTRRPSGAAVVLEKYLQELGDAPFSEERKDSLRQDATKLLEELKTPK